MATPSAMRMDTMLYPNHCDITKHGGARFNNIRTRIGQPIEGPGCEFHLRLLMRGIEAARYDSTLEVSPICRIEIFNDYRLVDGVIVENRGAAAYCEDGYPVFHVVDALIGYRGKGPSLTRALLHEATRSHEIFEKINTAYWGGLCVNEHYNVIVQATTTQDGATHWEWASVSPDSISYPTRTR